MSTTEHYDLALSVKYVIDPHTFRALEDRTVLISGGRVARTVPRTSKVSATQAFDYGDAVILPAFVNAHAHIDLSHLRGQNLDGSNFGHWLSCVVEGRKAPVSLIQTGAAGACQDMLATGTAAVMDVLATNPGAIEIARTILESGIKATIAIEVIGIAAKTDDGALAAALALANQVLDEILRKEGEDLACYVERMLEGEREPQVALSPHAPYTTGTGLYERVAEYAGRMLMLQTTHLAESPAEREFMLRGTGAFRDLFEKFGMDFSAHKPLGLAPHAMWLKHVAPHTQSGVNDTLFAHCYDMQSGEIEALGSRGPSVAYCPRSREFFGHSAFKFAEFVKAGWNVCIGTDSLASNHDLNLLHELQEARRQQPEVSAEQLWRAATVNGRAAMRGDARRALPDVLNYADLHVMRAPTPASISKLGLLDAILEDDPVSLATIVRGKLVYQHV